MKIIKLLLVIILGAFSSINGMEIKSLLNNAYESKNTAKPNKRMKITFICEAEQNSYKKHECRYCGRFYYKSYLPKHIRSHTLEKPFVCNYKDKEGIICGKAYSQISGLNFHKRSHEHKRSVVDLISDYINKSNQALSAKQVSK